MRISIEGVIATGKSEALEAVRAAFPTVPIYPEPLDEWGDLLDLYYANKSTWCLPFSLKVLLSFRRSNGVPSCVIERSPLSCKSVFTTMLVDDGVMNQRQYDVFKEYYDIIGWLPDAIVFIDTPAATCLTRVESRGRPCERGVDMQFLRRLEYAYETMLKNETHGIRIVRIDGTKPKDQVAADVVHAVATLLGQPSQPG
jgi:deoxyadenosine/deoxycytidine kinase